VVAFLFILLYRFIRGVSMKKLKKPFYFILGFLFVPVILSNLVAYILNSSDENMLVGYFALVYLIIYLSFPKLYSKDVPRRFPNKYMFYFWEYLIFFIFGVVLGLYICGFAK